VSRHIPSRFSSSALRWAVGLLSCVASWHAAASIGAAPAQAAVVVVRRPMWDNIDAQLAYAHMIRTLAEARDINAQAVAKEIQNSVDYVNAFYARRHIYEEEYRKKHPDELAREDKRQERMQKRLDQYQAIIGGGDRSRTLMLNWLLQELSSSVSSLQWVLGGKSPLQPEVELKLTHPDLQRIWLTDGGREGSRLVFAAGDGKVFLPPWPLALRRPKCDAARDDFDRARDAVEKEIKATGKVSYESQTKLMQAVMGLYAALDAAYPAEKRKDSREFSDYAAGKACIETLMAATHRAISINDPSAFIPQPRFEGDSLFGLIQYMNRNGLKFATPPRSVDAKGVYEKLFQNLRMMYKQIGQDKPQAAAQQRDATEANQAPKNQDEPKKDRDV